MIGKVGLGSESLSTTRARLFPQLAWESRCRVSLAGMDAYAGAGTPARPICSAETCEDPAAGGSEVLGPPGPGDGPRRERAIVGWDRPSWTTGSHTGRAGRGPAARRWSLLRSAQPTTTTAGCR